MGLDVIEAGHAHPDRYILPTWCGGSTYPPTVQSAGHGICPVCEQPFLLRSGKIPEHRA